MKTLFEAIYNEYADSTLADSLTALYNTQAPPDATFPYGVFTLVSDVPDWTFTENFENCLIQFSLFDDSSSSSDICDYFELLKTTFDFHDLVIGGYTIISFTREVANLIKVENVWHYTATYRIVFQKN